MKKLITILVLISILLGYDHRVPAEKLSAVSTDGIYQIVCGNMAGTGVGISSRQITTAAHVLESSTNCYARSVSLFNQVEQVVQLKVTVIDRNNDYALFETYTPIHYRTMVCKPSDFDIIYTIVGYPSGEPIQFSKALSLDPYINISTGATHLRPMESEIKPGMSGGPVMDQDGNIWGFLVGRLTFNEQVAVVKEYNDLSVCKNAK